MLHFIQAPVKQQGDVLIVRLVQLTHLFVLFVSLETHSIHSYNALKDHLT